MDFHSVYSHKSMMVDNLNQLYILVERHYVNIRYMDFQVGLANMCKLVDDFFLRNEHSQHMNQYHRLFDKHDSIDRRLHHLNNLHCIDKYLVHMISMDFLQMKK